MKFFLAFFLALLFVLSSAFFPLGIGIVRSQENAVHLMQQAATLYQTEQFQAALEMWQRSTQMAKQQGDLVNQAIALSNLALTDYQLGDWQNADIAISESLTLLESKSQPYAQALDIRGHLHFARGQTQQALADWEAAAAIYTQTKDSAGFQINQLNRSQALQQLGLLPQAEDLLKQLQRSLTQSSEPLLQVKGFRSLGQVYERLGKLDEAQTILNQSNQLAQQLPLLDQQRETQAGFLSLGNVLRAIAEREREQESADVYQETTDCPVYTSEQSDAYHQAEVALATYKTAGTVQAQINQLRLLRELQQESVALQLLPIIQTQLRQLPSNRTSVYARIHLARSLMCFTATTAPAHQVIAEQLAIAIKAAQNLKDSRAESYAIGTLGHLYELEGQQTLKQWFNAQKLTQQALLLAQSTNSSDITYLWQWQLGRILKETPEGKNRQQAIDFYSQAVKTLESIRNDLVGTNPDIQFSFRDKAEPVYRELVDLLLRDTASDGSLTQAIQVIDSLQVAELENFFRCVLSQLIQVDQVATQEDPSAAIFYPILLPDRLEVILKVPGQTKPIHYSRNIPRKEVETTVRLLRKGLSDEQSGIDEYQASAQQIYDWLIRPAESYLANSQAKTLVFILDASLRNLPMSALWDGQKFLVENYAIATTPGFQILGPKRLQPRQLRALIAGLTAPEPGQVTVAGRTFHFDRLLNTQAETQKVKQILPSSVELVGDQFQPNTLRQQLTKSAFPIVHLSTHGNFSANPQETFILTAASGVVGIEELQSLLRSGKQNRPDAIELLVLSACETAKGDRRAALGMAGAAVRSGASSTLATLWSVDEASTTELIGQFYQNLRQVIEQRQGTKAEALRQAQLTVLKDPKYRHPYYWSPFILLGNWL
ncbi:CHAT domain-containing protein [Phormidesmis priestleyi ANT.L61.2]